MRTRLATITTAAATGIAVVFLAGCSAPSAGESASGESEAVFMSADYPAYDTLEDAAEEAALIVTGEYVSSETELLYPTLEEGDDPESNPQQGVAEEDIDLDELAVVTTVSQLRVTEVIKGDVQVGDIIEVSQLGGAYDDVEYNEENTTLLEDIDAEVVLFLNPAEENRFNLINPEQGLYTMEDGTVEPVDDEEGFAEIATIEDIREVIE